MQKMVVKLNKDAVEYARSLVHHGKAVHDQRDAWSEDAPSPKDENAFIDKNGYAEYAKWHLGVDSSKPAETKGRYSFPFGDFSRVHRCAVISLESRAAQNDHNDIAKAAKDLLQRIDESSTAEARKS
jgi:hypothetical protein